MRFGYSLRWGLTAILVLIGVAAIVSHVMVHRRSEDLSAQVRQVVADNSVRLRSLCSVADGYVFAVADAAQKARSGWSTWAESARAVRQATQRIREAWDAYRATSPTGKEAEIAADAERLRGVADGVVEKIAAALAAEDVTALDALLRNELRLATDPLQERLARLIDLQVAGADGIRMAVEAGRKELEASLGIALGILLVAVAAGALVAHRMIGSPLARLTSAMRDLESGARDAEVPCTNLRTEIGEVARAAESLRRSLIAAQAEKRQALRAMADQVETETGAAVRHTVVKAGDLDGTAASLVQLAGVVRERSHEIMVIADDTKNNIETVAGATFQLTMSINEIGDQAQHARDIAQQVGAAGDAVRTKMSELDRAVTQIGEVTRLIEEIADKTNLLALNATIEAARAGPAGRGFAVVASEVKQLASSTARATQDITRHIAAVTDSTREALDTVAQIGSTLGQIQEVTSVIATAVQTQSTATEAIFSNIEQVSIASCTVAERMRDVTTESQAAADQSSGVREASSQLSRLVDELSHSLNRIVRNATPETERRRVARREGSWPGRLDLGGRQQPVTVVDVSSLGAHLKGVDDVQLGASATLTATCLVGPIRARVAYVDAQGIGLEFDGEAALAEPLAA